MPLEKFDYAVFPFSESGQAGRSFVYPNGNCEVMRLHPQVLISLLGEFKMGNPNNRDNGERGRPASLLREAARRKLKAKNPVFSHLRVAGGPAQKPVATF